MEGAAAQSSFEATESQLGNTDSETDPLIPKIKAQWEVPRYFFWIEVAIFANVFLSGFDGTITASTYTVISSEFGAANSASWLTTSYLITSTAFQPLYGRFSDIMGRRNCFFTSTLSFMIGCLGCAVAQDIVTLNLMRSLTGIGGGGLMTMATIINSDMIPFEERGMYQAVQNVLHGLGSICGASVGGAISDSIGWRYCFGLQIPVSILALVIGYVAIKETTQHKIDGAFREMWKRIDISGSCLLVLGLSSQLIGLSLGGNILPWNNIWVISSLLTSFLFLVMFVVVEARTTASPIIPVRMLQGVLPVATQIANVCVGMAAYAFLFMLPLLFQVVLQDSAAKAGARLVIPSIAAPAGSLVSGIIMSRFGKLGALVRMGTLLMFIGNGLIVCLKFEDSTWKYYAYSVTASFGQGVVYPGILFTFLAAFDHADHAVSASLVYLIRSLGTVYGVSFTALIVQNVLSARLPAALSGIPNKWEVLERIKHSTEAIRELPLPLQSATRLIYYDGIRISFAVTAGVALIASIASIFTKGKGLQRAEV